MPDYSKCVIYKLCCKDLNIKDIYVGSTCNFINRKHRHKLCCYNENDTKKYNYKVYKFIRENGGFENWDMILIEEYSCENKQQKLQRERYWLEELKASLNGNVPGRDIKEYLKEYHETNKERISEKLKEKMTCECGSVYRKADKLRHEKSKKHLDYINKN